MTTYDIAAQAIGILAMLFNIASFQQKRQRAVIACQLGGALLFSLHFFMLGAVIGGILNAIGAVRAVVFIFREKFRADHPLWLAAFLLTYGASYLLTFTLFGKEPTAANLIVELLPVIGMVATTISFHLTDARAIRRFGLISSPSWLIYNIINHSIGAVCCEVLCLCSILTGMARLDRKPTRS